MDESLKNQAYLEGSKLKQAGYDSEVIFARLEKQGIPEDLAKEVIANLFLQQKKDVAEMAKPFYNIALIRIGIGVFLAIASAIVFPGVIYLPFGLVIGGIVSAVAASKKMKK